MSDTITQPQIEITLENIVALLQGLTQDVQALIERDIVECYRNQQVIDYDVTLPEDETFFWQPRALTLDDAMLLVILRRLGKLAGPEHFVLEPPDMTKLWPEMRERAFEQIEWSPGRYQAEQQSRQRFAEQHNRERGVQY